MAPADSPSTLRTRPSLLFRLRNWRDEASWSEFYRMYYDFIYHVGRKAGLGHSDAQEMVQDVFKRVAETIHEFESNPDRGTFRSWLMQLTRWRITDKFRARKPHELNAHHENAEQAEDRTRTIERLPDSNEFEAGLDAEWKQHVLEAALGRLARRVPAKHFQIFELYTRRGWSVLRVSREFGINPASVYLIAHRLTKQLKTEVAAIQKLLDEK